MLDDIWASRQASSNYSIDTDGTVGLHVEESRRAWTSSSSANDNVAVTIEVANDEKGGEWHVSDAALAKLIDLCEDICRRNGIPQLIYTGRPDGTLTHHNMFALTSCPGPYLQSEMPYIAAEVNKRLGTADPDYRPMLRFGDSGPYVTELQKLLGGISVDGDFGGETDAAVVDFQIAHGLVPDGIVGVKTWAALLVPKSEPDAEPDISADIVATVDAALADGVIGDGAHWRAVLAGLVKPVPEYIKALMDNAHRKISG
jgi:hypothetical protein